MRRITKYFINSLIVFYLGVIYFSGVPETNTLTARLKEKATNIAFVLGIWPSWSMFAPNPIKFDSKSFVELTYQSGLKKEYDVEKDPKGVLAPFRRARWMKYSQDNLRNPGQKGLLRPAVNYFARKYSLPDDPVVNVRLIRRWWDVELFSDHKLSPISSTPRKEFFEVLISERIER